MHSLTPSSQRAQVSLTLTHIISTCRRALFYLRILFGECNGGMRATTMFWFETNIHPADAITLLNPVQAVRDPHQSVMDTPVCLFLTTPSMIVECTHRWQYIVRRVSSFSLILNRKSHPNHSHQTFQHAHNVHTR